MNDLGEKEIELYESMNSRALDLMTAFFYALKDPGFIWKKSKYGLGYNIVELNGGRNVSSEYYQRKSLGEDFQRAIPYNADAIIEIARLIVSNALSFDQNEKDEFLRGKDLDIPPPFSFQIFRDKMMAVAKVFDDEIQISFDEKDNHRFIALKTLNETVNHLFSCHKPSISTLKKVMDIRKDFEGEKTILLSDEAAYRRFCSLAHNSIFFDPKADRMLFVEGIFRIRSGPHKNPSTLLSYEEVMKEIKSQKYNINITSSAYPSYLNNVPSKSKMALDEGLFMNVIPAKKEK